jgi:hypothetical protein
LSLHRLLLLLHRSTRGTTHCRGTASGRNHSAPRIRSGQRRLTTVCNAARVIQIPEHRWTLSDSAEQVAEFPERARPDDVSVEVVEVIRLRLSFLCVNAEVVVPEVRHHFLELPLARDGARDARRLKLGNDLAREIVSLLSLAAHRDTVGAAHGVIAGRAPHLPALAELFRVLSQKIVRASVDRGISRDERFQAGVIDPFGMELLLDPLVEPDGSDLLHITGSRAEAETVDRVDYLLVGWELTRLCGERAGNHQRNRKESKA